MLFIIKIGEQEFKLDLPGDGDAPRAQFNKVCKSVFPDVKFEEITASASAASVSEHLFAPAGIKNIIELYGYLGTPKTDLAGKEEHEKIAICKHAIENAINASIPAAAARDEKRRGVFFSPLSSTTFYEKDDGAVGYYTALGQIIIAAIKQLKEQYEADNKSEMSANYDSSVEEPGKLFVKAIADDMDKFVKNMKELQTEKDKEEVLVKLKKSQVKLQEKISEAVAVLQDIHKEIATVVVDKFQADVHRYLPDAKTAVAKDIAESGKARSQTGELLVLIDDLASKHQAPDFAALRDNLRAFHEFRSALNGYVSTLKNKPKITTGP